MRVLVARLHVRSDGRLVQQQQCRTVQQRYGGCRRRHGARELAEEDEVVAHADDRVREVLRSEPHGSTRVRGP